MPDSLFPLPLGLVHHVEFVDEVDELSELLGRGALGPVESGEGYPRIEGIGGAHDYLDALIYDVHKQGHLMGVLLGVLHQSLDGGSEDLEEAGFELLYTVEDDMVPVLFPHSISCFGNSLLS